MPAGASWADVVAAGCSRAGDGGLVVAARAMGGEGGCRRNG